MVDSVATEHVANAYMSCCYGDFVSPSCCPRSAETRHAYPSTPASSWASADASPGPCIALRDICPIPPRAMRQPQTSRTPPSAAHSTARGGAPNLSPIVEQDEEMSSLAAAAPTSVPMREAICKRPVLSSGKRAAATPFRRKAKVPRLQPVAEISAEATAAMEVDAECQPVRLPAQRRLKFK